MGNGAGHGGKDTKGAENQHRGEPDRPGLGPVIINHNNTSFFVPLTVSIVETRGDLSIGRRAGAPAGILTLTTVVSLLIFYKISDSKEVNL
ncbi:hypothetical protein FACS1894137_01930 [Spirochaetia bacterium]|nr:hypothetical protein FACS1894137_01930 [Spirochaetia bacterium]